MPSKVRLIRLEDLPGAPFPAWTILTDEQLRALRAAHPEFRASVRLILRDYHGTLLVRVEGIAAKSP